MDIAAVSFLLTKSWPWEEIGWDHYRTGPRYRLSLEKPAGEYLEEAGSGRH